MIFDQYNNQLIGLGFRQWGLMMSQQCENDKKNKKHKVIDNSFKEIYDPFIYVTDSEGNIILSEKSNKFYTNGEINLKANKIKSGDYNVELSIDVAPAGSISAKSGFKVTRQ